MKALSCSVIITSASTRADGSLGLRLATPELKPDEKTAFFEIQGRNCKMILQPIDEAPDELKTVAKELSFKTPSQRLRGVLFVEYRQKKPDQGFEEYYLKEMERIIEYRKSKLEPEA